MSRRKHSGFFTIAILSAAIAICMPARVVAAKSESFVSYAIAAVRIDGNPPPEWNLYHLAHGKFNEIVILEWGRRIIRLDEHLKEAREIKAESVTRKKGSITWTVDDSASKVLPSDEWIYRDVGNVQRLHLVLTAESHEIEIDLPHFAK
jgi:hypothetical protein